MYNLYITSNGYLRVSFLTTILFQCSCSREQESAKLCTLYLLEDNDGLTTPPPPLKTSIVHSFQLNNNINQDPITKSGFAFLLDKKVAHFVGSICSPILSCLWNSSKITKVSIINISSLKKKSVSCSRQVKAGPTSEENRKRLDRGRRTFEDFDLFDYHSCKSLCCTNSRDFIYWLYDGFTCHFRNGRLCIIISSLIETTSPSFPLVMTT